MTRLAHAALLDQAELSVARALGFLAAVHHRPLGGCLEPKHKTPEIAAAFREGHAEALEAMAD